MRRGRLRISMGFWVLLGVLFCLDEGVGLLLPGLLVCALHELGHAVVLYALGGRVLCLELTAVGAEMKLDPAHPLSYGREMLVALAGPLSSFLCAWAAARLGWWLAAGLSVGQGLFNLLPVPPLDGGRALYTLLAAWGGDGARAERLLTWIAAVVVGLLFGLSFILLRRYGNPTLTITSLWLLAGTLGGRRTEGKDGTKTKKILAFTR